MVTPGEGFARALAAGDAAALAAVLSETVDFAALTPGRHWAAGTASEVARTIVLGHWFGRAERIELLALTTAAAGGREHVAYRLGVRRDGQDFLVEQQAYYDSQDGRITWLRVLCSGYQPVSPGSAPISP